MSQDLATELTVGTQGGGTTILDAVVGVYAAEADLHSAIKHLERERCDMRLVSVLCTAVGQEPHVVGLEPRPTHIARGATWNGIWGWIMGAFLLVPGVGQAAPGRRLLFLPITAGIGTSDGPLVGTLTSMGIPTTGVPRYEADLRAERFLAIAHGNPGQVARIRDLLGQTCHERLDQHAVPARVPSPSSATVPGRG